MNRIIAVPTVRHCRNSGELFAFILLIFPGIPGFSQNNVPGKQEPPMSGDFPDENNCYRDDFHNFTDITSNKTKTAVNGKSGCRISGIENQGITFNSILC